MEQHPKKYDDDDGRVICNMDVEGMRWHRHPARHETPLPSSAASHEKMTRSEARRFTGYALRAGLVVALIFSVVWVLFTLFCTQVWFR